MPWRLKRTHRPRIALAIEIAGWQDHKCPEGARLRRLKIMANAILQCPKGHFANLPAREFIRQGKADAQYAGD